MMQGYIRRFKNTRKEEVLDIPKLLGILSIPLFMIFLAPLVRADVESDTQGLIEVAVDLASGIFKAVLPFDTPFLIKGTVPSKIIRVSGEYYDVSGLTSSELEELLKQGPSNIGKPYRLTTWRNDPELDGQGEKTFYLFVPNRLKPNRHFLFQFFLYRQMKESELETFQKYVWNRLDNFFQSLEESKPISLGQEQLKDIQDQVKDILETVTLGPGESLDFEVASFFTIKVSEKEKVPLPPWVDYFDGVYKTQLNRRNALESQEEEEKNLYDAMRKMHNESVGEIIILEKLSAGLEKLSMREIESLAPILSKEKIEIVKALVKAKPGKLGFIAKGQETLVPFEEDKRFDKELQDIWALEDLERTRANYRKTLIQMEAISSLLKMTERFEELKKAAGLHIELIYPISENAYRAIESLENIITRIDRLESILQERNKALSTLSDFLQREVEIGVPVMATTRGSFDTRARQHISADFGLAYIRKINEIISYAGANIYFRPINRDVPLREYSTLWHRFSLFIGITLNSIQKKEEIQDVERIVRDDLFGNSAILIGGGLRLTDTIRLSGGGLIFKHIDSNSQNGDLELTIKPFVAISFDLNIKPILENLGEAIAGK